MTRFKFLLFLSLLSILTFAQPAKDIFEVARFGTLEDIKSIYELNPTAIDTVNSYGFNPLILATYRGNNEVAKFIAEHTKNINYVSDMGSALHACVFKGNVEVFNKLFQYRINLNHQDNNQVTALMLAVTLQNVEFVEKLLSQGADKSVVDKDQKNAFQLALQTNNQKIINLFNN